jgi:hypothetical protein
MRTGCFLSAVIFHPTPVISRYSAYVKIRTPNFWALSNLEGPASSPAMKNYGKREKK